MTRDTVCPVCERVHDNVDAMGQWHGQALKAMMADRIRPEVSRRTDTFARTCADAAFDALLDWLVDPDFTGREQWLQTLAAHRT